VERLRGEAGRVEARRKVEAESKRGKSSLNLNLDLNLPLGLPLSLRPTGV